MITKNKATQSVKVSGNALKAFESKRIVARDCLYIQMIRLSNILSFFKGL